MPFVDQSRRFALDKDGIKSAEAVGDICYLAYKEIMKRWKAEPRWTTIHEIKRAIEGDLGLLEFGNELPPQFDLEDIHTAEVLAFEVFFYTKAMAYEFQKRFENGDIE